MQNTNTGTRVATWMAISILGGAAGLLGGCGEEPAPIKEVVRPVKVMEVAGTGVTGQRRYPGTVRANQQVDLSFQVPGKLVELPIMEGQHVKQRQILGRLDDRDYRSNMQAAEAQNVEARANFERGKELIEKDFISKAQLDKLMADADVASANVDKARKAFADTRLRAPFSGRIGRRFVENFQDVKAKEPILSLLDVTSMEILVDVPESIVARARMGNPPELVAVFESRADRQLPLSIKEMATTADPKTQTYQVRLSMVPPDDLNILPGMTATVIATQSEEQRKETGSFFVIPAVAVFADDAGKPHVWVVDEEDQTSIEKRPVTTGEFTGSDQIRISEGLNFGETIVIGGVSRLREGMKIRPIKEVSF